MPQRDIAREAGLKSVRQVQRVLDAADRTPARAAPLLEPEPEPVVIDPRMEVCMALAELRQVGREARRLAGEAKQEAVQVAALKLLAALPVQRIELLGQFGALPQGPAWVGELRLAAAWHAMSEMAVAAGVDVDELRSRTEERVREHYSADESNGYMRLAELAPLPREPEAAAA